MKTEEVMEALINRAKMYMDESNRPAESIVRNKHMNSYRGEAPSEELVAAIVTDFINFCAFTNGMDLGLYTVDITSVK